MRNTNPATCLLNFALAARLVAMVAVSSPLLGQPSPRDAERPPTAIVGVYRDYFEYGGMPFFTIDQLREALVGKSITYAVRQCGADEKVRELVEFIVARSGGRPVNISGTKIPKCD